MSRNFRWWIILLCLFAHSMAQPSIVVGRDIRVPKDFTTIQAAIDAALEGDHLQVAEGVYLEQIRLKPGLVLEGGWNRQFSERNIDLYPTVLDAKDRPGWVIFAADRIVLDGFMVRNGTLVKTDQEEYGSGLYCVSVHEVVIRNNTFCQNDPSGIYAAQSTLTITNNKIFENLKAGIHLAKSSSALIELNAISRNKEAGISSKGEGLCQLEVRWNRIFQNKKSGLDGQNAIGKIFNNFIYENEDAGLRSRLSPLEIVNNTIVHNKQSGVVVDDQSKEILIKNNIIAYNQLSGIMSYQRGYRYNLLYGNARSEGCDPACLPCIRAQHAGNEDEESYLKLGQIIAHPQFVDPNGHDYHLLPGSAAIDAGDPAEAGFDKNFPPSLGTERNDLGAYGGPFTLAEERVGSNHSPQPKIIAPAQIYQGEIVKLDAAQSRDPDGDALKYSWALVAVPLESRAKIAKPDKAQINFRADLPGTYQASLQVIDRWGAQEQTLALIEVEGNHPPEAYAGENLEEVSVGDTIQLFGDVSTDDDHDPLTYQWQLVAKPVKSQAILSNTFSPSPTFTLDQPGCYLIQLIVSDGKIESHPAQITINTVHESADKIRFVPDQYPTIQSAVDAAQQGDTIVIQGGTYRENIYIDKPIHLKGIDWPIIDGGSQPGNIDTLKIANLGERAGRVEGLVITGGGSGPLGHGLSAWDSSPVICNNQFIRNPNNGLGIHGQRQLSGKTQVYGNIVTENKGGIGNGRGGCGYIHHNYIFRNSVFGIGCRGFSSPRIEANHIFENAIGIGMREVSSPRIIGNYLYRNVSGIRLSPVTTVKTSKGEDILIVNNLIIQNEEDGLMVSSSNQSLIVIVNNTIDSNHQGNFSPQGGGIVLGWPWPGDFEVVIQNNIISNNGGFGLLNYIGTEDFKKEGVRMKNTSNTFWNNTKDYQGCEAGQGDDLNDPLFIKGGNERWQSYFLSGQEAGQSQDSPCLNTGVETTLFSYSDTTTSLDLKSDTGKVDRGFHYLPSDYKQDWPALVQDMIRR